MSKDLQKIAILGVVLVAAGFFIWQMNFDDNREPVSPDTDMKNADEQAFDETMSTDGLSLEYPENVGTEFIDFIDWPPVVRVVDGPLECSDAGEETARAGRSETRTINGRTYCVTSIVEGAAGSVYTQYAYAREFEGGVAIMNFSTREPQCANFDEPLMSNCRNEQGTFDVDDLIDSIMQTLKETR